MTRQARDRSPGESDEAAEPALRRRARHAREVRALAQDRAHEATLARYGRSYEQLFRSAPKRRPPQG